MNQLYCTETGGGLAASPGLEPNEDGGGASWGEAGIEGAPKPGSVVGVMGFPLFFATMESNIAIKILGFFL